MDHHQMVLALGFVAGALYIASHYMKTMVPLRLTSGRAPSSLFFAARGAPSSLLPSSA